MYIIFYACSLYATNNSIINKNTVYTRICPEDQTKVNLATVFSNTTCEN